MKKHRQHFIRINNINYKLSMEEIQKYDSYVIIAVTSDLPLYSEILLADKIDDKVHSVGGIVMDKNLCYKVLSTNQQASFRVSKEVYR